MDTSLRDIPVEQIDPSPYQSRRTFDGIERLAQSIQDEGLINPITVRPMPGGRYELVAGERRWRAVKSAGLDTIPSIVRELTDSQARRLALAENAYRRDLSPVEEASGFLRHTDAELWLDEDYRRLASEAVGADELDEEQSQRRARWLLVKLDSDGRHNTDYFANKFIRKIVCVVSPV